MNIRQILEMQADTGQIISKYFDCDLEAFIFALRSHEKIKEKQLAIEEDADPGLVLAKMKRSKEFRRWWNMMQRCYNNKVDSFRYYGGKGVIVCERWHSFENFHSDMGFPPTDNHSIDRKNSSGNYEPDNCRWATPDLQVANRQLSPKGSVCMINGKWRALVRVKGSSKSKYFTDHGEAQEWSIKTAMQLNE